MIKVRQGKSVNLKTKQALFVGFDYDMEKVAKIKTLPKRYYIPQTKEWEVPVANINNVIAMFQDEEIQVTGKVNSKVKAAAKVAQFEKVDTQDFEFKTQPYGHQLEGFEYGIENNKFLLADEQGLGKTKQAIDIAVARRRQFKHCLIVAGVNGLKWNWLKEINIHSNEGGYLLGSYMTNNGKLKAGSTKYRLDDLENIEDIEEFFIVTNVETLRNKEIQAKLEELTTKGIIGMTIIDEIHKAKNPTSQQGKAIHKLKSFYKMALTGTPLMNKPLDLYNTLKWLDAEHSSYYGFRNRYAVMGGFGGYQVVGYKNLNELKTKLDKIMLRRKKTEVLDLPPKVRVTEYVEMGGKQKKIYKGVLNEIKAELDQIKMDPNPLAKLIRLRQATGNTGILSSSIEESAKLDRLEELVEEMVENGEKVIVFSNWEKVLTPAINRLRKYRPAVITGKTKDRMEQVEKFQNSESCKVIAGTIGAMGTGLTLTAATNVIFLDSPWNMANKEQAEDRAHRIGTTSAVNVITLVTKDTIDERIEEIVEEKKDMAEMLVDGKIANVEKAKLVDFLIN